MNRRSRLLLVVPAATALVFTGISPALAGGGHDGHHNGHDDVWIVDIDRVEIENDDEARVYFTYECDDDTDDLSAKAVVRQDGTRYESKDKEDIDDCTENGDEQEDSVLVKKDYGDELDADEDAKVRVVLYEDDDEVDSETDYDVDVEDDDDDDDDNGNGKDKDNGHH
ncbi:hypothetical protein ACI78V_00910 [Geodermatophilus sp. SYSU D00742]